MAAAIPPRPEDVYGGGGSFSACLSRAIRHTSTTVTQTQNANNNNNSIATPTNNTGVDNNIVPSQPGTQLIDTSSTYASTADNQDNKNDNTQEGTQSLTQTPIKIPRAPSSIEYKTPQRRAPRWDAANSNNNNSNEQQQQQLQQNDNDWSQHHISYNKLRSTLHYFSKRRSLLRTKLRSSTTTIAIDGNSSGNNKGMSEEEFNICVIEFGSFAPFLNNNNSTNSSSSGADNGSLKNYDRAASYHHHPTPSSENLMEYADERALGMTPPGGGMRKRVSVGSISGSINSVGVGGVSGEGNVEGYIGELNATALEEGENSSPYVQMDPSNNPNTNNNYNSNLHLHQSILDEVEITKRLSFMERSELSAVLDSEVERASQFYRKRVSELAPPRVDGGTLPSFDDVILGCGGLENVCHTPGSRGIGGMSTADDGKEDTQSLLSTTDINDDDELIDTASQSTQSLSFTDMASEILELHAYITTNIIVVRQVLIKYDAFVRSLGGTPMGSWYQTTRRLKVNGRSSDYRDLVNHSKLKKLTKAYILEYKRHVDEAEELQGDVNGTGIQRDVDGNIKPKRKKRLHGLSMAFYKIVDAGEELKKRQRLKWRQSAMHLDGDEDDDTDMDYDGDEEDKLESGKGADAGVVDAGVVDEDGTPVVTSAADPTATPANTKTTTSRRPIDMETPPPNPPLQPVPDYSTLKTNPDIGEDIAYQVHIFKCVQSKTQRSIEKTYTGHISGVHDNFISTIREYFLLGSGTTDNLSLMPEYLIMRGKSLKSSLLVVAQWREARNAFLSGVDGGETIHKGEGVQGSFGGFCGGEGQPPSPRSSSSFKSNFALSLNIFACFIYMMNYYIVEPSSTRYANALGKDDAMSGLIIGAMPWAAMISAVMYSVWTNRVYKAPLITSGVLLITGNFLYATAYRYESIGMALCGRFLTGLGGPRSMNRRYIADVTPLAQRTAVNIAFGIATALGAALGPAAAIMLEGLNFQFELPLYGIVYVNGLTGPGLLMGFLWILFTLVLVLTFEEPHRSGLEEQMRREEEQLQSALTVTETMMENEYEMTNLDASKNTLRQNSMLEDTTTTKEEDQEKGADRSIISTDDAEDFEKDRRGGRIPIWQQAKFVSSHITWPVRICMFLLFSKMFTVETVISAASMLTKNRYEWTIQQRGTLGTIVGLLTIPISIFIGWASQYREDRLLMLWLISFAAVGMALLIDVSDFIIPDTFNYNQDHSLAVGPSRYISGYVIVFCSLQAFDGVVGSVLSKVIPTALATGTLNSGLLATLIGTLGRGVGDVFITFAGYIDLRQIMNLLSIPSFLILVSNLILICYNYDSLTA